MFRSLRTHLTSPALSQMRNIFYQENLATTRQYILDYWRALCQAEIQSSPDTYPGMQSCDDLYIVRHYLAHDFGAMSYDDYIPYYVENPEDVFPMEYEGENVILIVKGTRWGTNLDQPVVVGAHYDTFGNSSGEYIGSSTGEELRIGGGWEAMGGGGWRWGGWE